MRVPMLNDFSSPASGQRAQFTKVVQMFKRDPQLLSQLPKQTNARISYQLSLALTNLSYEPLANEYTHNTEHHKNRRIIEHSKID
jgi:hypothetical protein